MKTVKKIIVIMTAGTFFALFQQTAHAVAPFGKKCDSAVLNTITKDTPESIFQRITRLYIPVFSKDSYIQEKIKEEDFIQWVNLLACLYEWIESSKKTKEAYSSLFLDFFKIANQIFGISKRIYTKRSLPARELNNLKIDAQKAFNEAKTISSIMLEIIAKSVDVSAQWKKGIPSKLEAIFPNYPSFFKSYEIGKKAKASRISDQEFENFLKINQIPIKKIELEDVLNKLEQLTYRLKQSWFRNALQTALIKESKEIADRIVNQYNQFKFFTQSMEDKLFRTPDRAALAAFAIADQYVGTLEKILKNINSLESE
jgi:hypothetical protein